MRLVIDGRRLCPRRTGVGRYLESLLAGWAERGLPLPETVVALKEPTGQAFVPDVPGLRAEVVGPHLPGLAWERWGLGRLLQPGDLLFAPTNLIPGFWSGKTVLVLFDLLLEVRPGDFPWQARLRFRRRYRRAARQADLVIVPSEATARDARHHFGVPPGRTRVIPPGIEPSFGHVSTGSVEEREARRALGLGASPYFLFVGKRSRRRHVPEVLAAFARHRRNSPDHRLVFVGVGPGERPGTVGSGPNVLDAGHVPEPILRGLLGGATALLYPSEHEGFGLPVVEAMACGCPVIALRHSALIESGGDAALFLDRAEPEALAEAMRLLANDPARRHRHVARGLAHAARFGRSRFADAVSQALLDVAREPSRIRQRTKRRGVASQAETARDR